MNKPFVFEKPTGFHDILPSELGRKRALEERILALMERWGYERIETPTLEFFDTLGQMSKTEEEKLFKVLDSQGRTLILRPEMTTPIARVTASLLKNEPFPIRLMYLGNVFRTPGKEAGKSAEFTQMGAELIGEEGLVADVEEIALAIEAVLEAGVKNFRIAISHARFIDAYLSGYLSDPLLIEELKADLLERNHVGYREKAESRTDSVEIREALLRLLRWHGEEALEDARRFSVSPVTDHLIGELKGIYALLSKLGYREHLIFDLTMRAKQGYYTGIFFEGFAEGVASSILNGGRYDHLIAEFGREAPATGFAIKVDRLLEIAPIPSHRKEKLLLLYPPEEVEEAFRYAERERKKGVIVSLHSIREEAEGEATRVLLDRWKKNYDRILYLTKAGIKEVSADGTFA